MPTPFVAELGRPVAAPGRARHRHRQRPGADPRLHPGRDVLRPVLLRPRAVAATAAGPRPSATSACARRRPTTSPCSTSRSPTSTATSVVAIEVVHDAPHRRGRRAHSPRRTRVADRRAGRARVADRARRCARASCRPRASTPSTASSPPASADQVVASSVDVERWIAKVDAEASADRRRRRRRQSGGPQYERPNISSAYARAGDADRARAGDDVARAARRRAGRSRRRLLRARRAVADRRAAVHAG